MREKVEKVTGDIQFLTRVRDMRYVLVSTLASSHLVNTFPEDVPTRAATTATVTHDHILGGGRDTSQ